ncbi:restriction endonuclease subunit S [Virgibacillus sp. MSP4-1]|uniref:restriction endonuclease subunit S n=1 Tax=Virgibacillus sp. MSP4-1 TaxID=2700081 RepID=UPI00039FA707|nr:restriction endonuclease subunit S [Virgibacillus sp. MSP4-1]QHS23764.1 restriction endonuclease subunit S [Virgibacillus sp. MSP4-1]
MNRVNENVFNEHEIRWLGDFPSSWKIGKLKFYLTTKSGMYISKSRFSNSGKYDVIGSNGAIGKLDDFNTTGPAILIGRVGSAGEINLLTKGTQAWITDNVLIIKPRKTHMKYLMYFLESRDLPNMADKTAQPLLTSTKIKNIYYLIPRLEEQKEIADFLDQKTSEIDELIADKERLIELLEEKRQAIITEAVTKGLDPNIEMQESSVDWIKKMPKHWKEKRIKYLFYDVNQRNFSEDVELLSLFSNIGVRPRREMEEKGNRAQTVINYKKVQKEDIIVNRILAWMGAIGLSEYEGVTSPDYDVYRALNSQVYSRYYHYYFRTPFFRGDCYKYGRGIMMMRWRTYPEYFKSILVPLPPIEEQKKIVECIDDINTLIQNINRETNKLIKKLKEYRQSMIYEAVTGKIDVRNYPLERKEEANVD